MYFYGSRCAVFKGQVSLTTKCTCRFLERVTTAAGIHLFPFRTEKLSPPAPMVLRGRLRGRVGRRPFFRPSDTGCGCKPTPALLYGSCDVGIMRSEIGSSRSEHKVRPVDS